MTQSTTGEAATDELDPRLAVLREAGLVAHAPGSPEYDALVSGFNLDLAVSPALVVEPSDAAEVATAVRLAGELGLGAGVRLTGHGLSPAVDDQLLVHTGRLTALEVDPAARRAHVGAGVLWQAVLDAAAPYGLGAVAGSAPAVSVVGYTTGGGLSPVGRTFGLGIDRVRSFEVVTGDGRVKTASPDENPDLWWALRGGRGTAGIVTSLELELVEQAELYGGTTFFAGEDAPAVLRAWAAWSAALPATATTSLAFVRMPPLPDLPPPLAGRFTVAVRFAWTGPVDQGPAVLEPMRAVAAPVLDTMGPLPFAALGAIHLDPVDPIPAVEDSTLLAELSEGAVDVLLALGGPDAECPQIIVEVRQMGGAMREGSDAAFAHREAGFTVHTVGLAVPPVREAAEAHATALVAALQPWSTGGRLPNFATRSDAAWYRSTYGEAGVERLREVVLAHDPGNVITGGRALRATTD